MANVGWQAAPLLCADGGREYKKGSRGGPEGSASNAPPGGRQLMLQKIANPPLLLACGVGLCLIGASLPSAVTGSSMAIVGVFAAVIAFVMAAG